MEGNEADNPLLARTCKPQLRIHVSNNELMLPSREFELVISDAGVTLN